jgi:hypothetical protein
MSFRGRTSSIVSENFDKGIDGMNALNAIANGSCIEMQNVDLSQPGRVIKRAGYHVYGERLPLRTRQVEVAAGLNRFVFDIIPKKTYALSLYMNTSINATATNDALYFRADDHDNTLFVTFTTTDTITTDTIFRAIGSDGLEHFVQPIVVFSSTGSVQMIFPLYVSTWFTAFGLSDTMPEVKKFEICSGLAHKKLVESDINDFSVAQVSPYKVRVTFPSASSAKDVELGATVFFETCLHGTAHAPISGTVVEVGNEYFDAETETAIAVFGTLSPSYFQMRYINAKHMRYVSPTYSFDVTGLAHTAGVWNILIRDASSLIVASSIITGTTPSTTVHEIGFLYGTSIEAGPVNVISKYFNFASLQDRVVCGVDGYLFAEGDHPATGLPTIASLIYSGSSVQVLADTVADTFTIPLVGASAVYAIGDTVTTQYSGSTTSVVATGFGVATDTFTVKSVTANSILVNASGLKAYFLRAQTKWVLTRTSSRVYIRNATSHLPLFPGMTVQVSVNNTLLPVFEILDTDYTGTSQFVDLDTAVTWSSDDVLVPQSVFTPVPADISCTFHSEQGSRIDVNCVPVERSVVIASGLGGMWRYNGAQLLNMRIPRVGSGWIRNVPGTGGTLHFDIADDGTAIGRNYAFLVTYSYSEIINGKLVNFESGLNPVSTYEIVSEQDDLKSSFSKLVELQVPTIPRGIGLPADDMYINVYRLPSGTLAGEASSEVYLLERQVPNIPDAGFITIVAGTEPVLFFTTSNYKVLYASTASNDTTPDELQREVVDPPLSTIVSTLENRVIAASGYDHPAASFICNDVFSTVDKSFMAHFDLLLKGQQLLDTSYRFMSCPLDLTTTSGTGGAKDGAFGGTGTPFQALAVSSYDIKTITYTDNSCFFKITGASITADVQYLLRLAAGKKEALSAGTADPYYNGYNFEGQVFTGTSTSTQVSSQKKWTRITTSNVVDPPVEQFLVFEKLGDITSISTTNGLVVIGNMGLDAKTGAIQLLLYTTLGITTNDIVILKGLGTTGQLKLISGTQVSFDSDLILEVTNAASPFILKPLLKGNTYNTHYSLANIATAVSVSNSLTSGGVVCPPFTIFKLASATARSTTNWTISPTTAQIQLTTSPSIAPGAGDRLCVDGLPSDVPPNSGFNYNTSLEVVSFAADTFVVKVTPPDTARGILTQDFTAETKKGKLIWAKAVFSTGTNTVRIRLTSATLSVAITSGDWVYLITKGENSDSYCLALTGWFRVARVTSDFSTWVSTLAVSATIVGVEIEYYQTLDYNSITGASHTRLLIMGRTGDGITTQLTLNIPVPVVNTRNGSQDITGILYSTIDGYTPLERVIRPLAHALNCVLHSYGSAYWGGRTVGNVEGAFPGNVIPTNGVKFMPFLNPDNVYKYRYYQGDIVSQLFEPQWVLTAQPGLWRVEGTVRQDVTGATYTPVALYAAKEYRPSRLWYTNPTGTLVGQAFRELSYDDIESQDGERITGMAPFQTYSLLAKQNSLWRLSFGGSDTLTRQKVPGIIGASSHKNMIATDRGVFFLHDTGIYISDGSVCSPIHQAKRLFDEKCVQNRTLFPLTSGLHSAISKIVTIGVPISSSETELTATIAGQFSFNYSQKDITLDSVMTGWSTNTNIEATGWIAVYGDTFYGGVNGSVMRTRTERSDTKYSDLRVAIPMSVQSRFIFADDNINGRFLRSLYFQFGKETGVNMDVSMSWDFNRAYLLIQTFTMPVDGFGIAPFGQSYFGCDKIMENQRKTPDVLRVHQFSIQFDDKVLDSSGAIYGMYMESTETSLKLIGQNGVGT